MIKIVIMMALLLVVGCNNIELLQLERDLIVLGVQNKNDSAISILVRETWDSKAPCFEAYSVWVRRTAGNQTEADRLERKCGQIGPVQ